MLCPYVIIYVHGPLAMYTFLEFLASLNSFVKNQSNVCVLSKSIYFIVEISENVIIKGKISVQERGSVPSLSVVIHYLSTNKSSVCHREEAEASKCDL